jgi:hypothetical protein
MARKRDIMVEWSVLKSEWREVRSEWERKGGRTRRRKKWCERSVHPTLD